MLYTAWQINRGLFAYVRTCKTRLDTTTKFVVVATSLFKIYLLFHHSLTTMFYHVWTWLLIYHDGSNNVVQVCSFIKTWTVCSITCTNKPVDQQHCSSRSTQPCSSLPGCQHAPSYVMYQFIPSILLCESYKQTICLTALTHVVRWFTFKQTPL